MAVRPTVGTMLVFQGTFSFTARSSDGEEVTDSFSLRIQVPHVFPRDLPRVTEIAGRIPRRGEFHINPDDYTLCLGSPVRLLTIISGQPTLTGFAANCLVPYLHAVSRRLKSNIPLVFGELDHGQKGALADYVVLFGLQHREQALTALRLLGMRKRVANKQRCPCNCGRRLGRCSLNRRLVPFRGLAGRSWYRTAALGRALGNKPPKPDWP